MQEGYDISDQPDDRLITLDTLFNGQLSCYQFKKGYRFSIDAVLVSQFSIPKKYDLVLDLGTGCGVIGLILLYRNDTKQLRITGLEKQDDLVKIARENISLNKYCKIFDVIQGDVSDIRNIFKPESFQMVITNPPFYHKASGRLSLNKESKTARHQGDTTLSSFISGAAYCLKNKGKISIIYPANVLNELLHELHMKNIEPKRVRFIYSYPESRVAAKLVLVEGVKNGGRGVQIEVPLYVYNRKGGIYSDEMLALYESHPDD